MIKKEIDKAQIQKKQYEDKSEDVSELLKQIIDDITKKKQDHTNLVADQDQKLETIQSSKNKLQEIQKSIADFSDTVTGLGDFDDILTTIRDLGGKAAQEMISMFHTQMSDLKNWLDRRPSVAAVEPGEINIADVCDEFAIESLSRCPWWTENDMRSHILESPLQVAILSKQGGDIENLEKLDLDASPDLQVASKDFSWMAENHKTMAENLETKYAQDLGHQAGVWGEQTLSTYSLDIQKMKRMQLRTYKKRQGATDMCYFGDKSRTKATLQLVMDPLRKQIEAFTMGLEASTSNILEKFPTIMEQNHETTQHKLVAFETTFNKITSMTQCFEFYKWLMEWKEGGVFEKLRDLIKVEVDNQGNSLADSRSLSSMTTKTIASQELEVKKLAEEISSILS